MNLSLQTEKNKGTMKRFFCGLIITLTAALAFTSCNKDDFNTGTYVMYEPITDWGISKSEVRSYMKGMSEWKEDKDSEDAGELTYLNKVSNAHMRFEFNKSAELNMSSVTYYGNNDKFQQMKDDWGKKLNLEWKENVVEGIHFFSARCEKIASDVIVQYNGTDNFEYMTVSFNSYNYPL